MDQNGACPDGSANGMLLEGSNCCATGQTTQLYGQITRMFISSVIPALLAVEQLHNDNCFSEHVLWICRAT